MDNKTPGNNGMGKTIRNIGMATVAAVTLGVGGKHVVEKHQQAKEDQKIEMESRKEFSEYLNSLTNKIDSAQSVKELSNIHLYERHSYQSDGNKLRKYNQDLFRYINLFDSTEVEDVKTLLEKYVSNLDTLVKNELQNANSWHDLQTLKLNVLKIKENNTDDFSRKTFGLSDRFNQSNEIIAGAFPEIDVAVFGLVELIDIKIDALLEQQSIEDGLVATKEIPVLFNHAHNYHQAKESYSKMLALPGGEEIKNQYIVKFQEKMVALADSKDDIRDLYESGMINDNLLKETLETKYAKLAQ